jgi:hypothetical protein
LLYQTPAEKFADVLRQSVEPDAGRHVTLSSSGSSPWQLTNRQGAPSMMIDFNIQIPALSSTYQIDVTMDDPTGLRRLSKRTRAVKLKRRSA